MKRSHRLFFAAAVAVVLVLALSMYLHSWGGLVFLAVAGAAFAWYRIQVARSEAAEQFFGDAGEETRLTSFQGGSPSEMPPLDRGVGPTAPPTPRR
jgi:nitrogen fixation protein FixH